jgi:hypothetical protein
MVQIALRFDTPETVASAAQFCAELVRQGVVTSATEDIGRHVSGLSGAPVLLVTLTGGF